MKTADNQEEILIVVDDHDNVLDYLPRSEVHAKKLLHRTITVVTFNSKGDLVFQKRSMAKDTYPGMYGNAIGGHVLKGQTFEEAAKQEAKEELDVELPLEFIKKQILTDPNHPTLTSVYKLVFDGPYKFNNEEIDEMVTVPLSEISSIEDHLSPPTLLTLNAVGILS